MKPKRKRSAAEIRRGQVARQLERLRSRLGTINPSQYADEHTYQREHGRAHELVSELEGELSMLDCPGEYAELPAAVVADELGLRLDQIRLLIRLGEVKAAGRRAHPRVSREELGRLARLGPRTLLSLSLQDAEQIYADAVLRLKHGDLATAIRAYDRIKARETCIGDYALALEIVISLAVGRYEDAERAVNFVLGEKLRRRDTVCSYLAHALRSICFKSDEGKSEAVRLLKLLGANSFGGAEEVGVASNTELTALFVAAAAQEVVRELVMHHLPPPYLDELNRRLRDAVFTVLYAQAHSGTSIRSLIYLAELKRRVPHFLEPLRLSDDLREE